jgi:hypothetical protein
MVIFVLAIIVSASVYFLIRRGVFLTPKSGGIFSTEQLNDAMEKSGGEKLLGKEAAEAILRFGSNDGASAYDLTNCPAITKMASLIGGEIVGMWPAGGGVPAHIRIRRGSHFDYQFVYIFETGSVPTSSSERLIHVGGPVYLRNTSK